MKALMLAILLPVGIAAGAYYLFFTPVARHERAVRQLIEATSMDEIERANFILAFKHSLERGDVSEAQYSCIVDVKRGDFTGLLAPGLQSRLTLEEARRAAEYYRSPLGAKFLRAVHFEVAKAIPDYPIRVAEEPRFDIDEFEAMSRWRHSDAGEKTWDTMLLADYSSEALMTHMRDRKADCKRRFP